jgi:CHAT domain-containing protein
MSHARLCLVAACLLGAASCQPSAVPLEQAKSTPAQFGAPGFVAPPRTIGDITEILDREQPDRAVLVARLARADAPVPAGLGPAEQARFLYDRSFAAGDLGRDRQRIDDLREALRLGAEAKLPPQQIERFWWQLAYAYERAGRRVERLEALDQRLAAAQSLGDSFPVAGALAARRSALLGLGRVDEAAATYREMARMIAVLNAGKLTAYQRDNLERTLKAGEASLLIARGKYLDAEPLQRAAVQAAEAVVHEHPTDPDLQERDAEIRSYADVLQHLGRLAESEVEARRALSNSLRRVGKYSIETTYAISALIGPLDKEGRAAEVEALRRARIEILEHLGHGRGSANLALARVRLGDSLILRGDARGGVDAYEAAIELVADQPAVAELFEANLLYARALIETGADDKAQRIARRLVERRANALGEASYDVAEARAVSAVARFGLNDRPGALAELRTALPVLLTQPSSSEESAESPRRKMLQWLFGRCLDLLSDHGRGISDRADLDAAFQIAEAGRGQAVQGALNAAAARAPALDPGLAALIRAEQDARLEAAALEATLSNLLALPGAQQRADDVARLRQQLAALRESTQAHRSEIDQRFPAYAGLTNPKPPSLEAARAALRPGEALIVTAVTDARTYVWAVPQQGAPAFAVARVSAADIAQQVARLRAALDPQAGRLADIPPFDLATSHALYAALLAPVKSGWVGAKTLIVVPDGALAQLPVSVLVIRPATVGAEREGEALFSSYRTMPWLAREAAITQLPSVAALAALRAAPPAPTTRRPFIGFGDPWFSVAEAVAAKAQLASAPIDEAVLRGGGSLRFRSVAPTERMASATLASLPRLPDTADELRAIATALGADPAKDVFVGPAANEQAVETTNLADRRVVAFATHGLVPGDLNGLTQPALALSAPEVAGVTGDGLLTMDKVLGLKLNADWVVLSACNTAAGEGAGAEALSGLGHAFFYAGTRALLASNWPVETRAARALTSDLFRRQASQPGLDRAEALRQAELTLIDGPGFVDPASGKTVFSYAHPIFWAPFSLVGDGGGAVE